MKTERVRKVEDANAMDLAVADFVKRGYEVATRSETYIRLRKPDWGTLVGHLVVAGLTAWWTCGLGNLLYALVFRFVWAEQVVIHLGSAAPPVAHDSFAGWPVAPKWVALTSCVMLFCCCGTGIIGQYVAHLEKSAQEAERVRQGTAEFDAAGRLWEGGEQELAAAKYQPLKDNPALAGEQRAIVASRLAAHARDVAAKALASANADWADGRKAEAVAKYRPLLAGPGGSLPDPDRQSAQARVKEYEDEQARQNAARDLKVADTAWDGGKKDDAAAAYRQLLALPAGVLAEDARKGVAARLDLFDTDRATAVLAQADHEQEAGKADRAMILYRRLADDARLRGLLPEADRRRVTALVAEDKWREVEELRAIVQKREKADRIKRLKESRKFEDNVKAIIELESGVVVVSVILVHKGGNEYEGEIVDEAGRKGSVEVTADGRNVLAKWQWLR